VRRARLAGVALAACALAACALAAAAGAQTVGFSGSIGERAALLVIDGQPRTVAVGATVQGVRLVALRGGEAEIEIDGRRERLRLGTAAVAAAVAAAGTATASAQEIVLTAGPGGHFTTLGSVNGRPVSFMVDTGATVIALGTSQADAIGLNWRAAPTIATQTANGPVAARAVTLDRVRVGEVEVTQVPAIVLPVTLPHALLGNSFLQRFQLKRTNDVMRLELRR
jgi:aspartyl protease family protein